jgi:hypothetical protein
MKLYQTKYLHAVGDIPGDFAPIISLGYGSKHMTDQPDVTTTRIFFFFTSPCMNDQSTTPEAMATARLPLVIRTFSGKRDTSAKTPASVNASSICLPCGSNNCIWPTPQMYM